MVLGNNQLVNIILSEIESVENDIITSINYSFSTTFDPLFSTPNRVRAVAGSYIQDISDEMLFYLIHVSSINAQNLAICSPENFTKWGYYTGLWVAYATALDAVMNSSMYIGNSGQKIYKKLGDFAISKDNSGRNMGPSENMLNKLKCEMVKLSVSVKFCKEPLSSCDKGLSDQDLRAGTPSQLVVKGGDLAKPMMGRMFHRQGNHPQMTGFIRILDRFRLTNAAPQYHDPEYNGNYNFNGRY